MAKPSDMISVTDAAKLRNISASGIRVYINRGDLRFQVLGKSTYLLRRSDVLALKLRPRGRPWPKGKAVAK